MTYVYYNKKVKRWVVQKTINGRCHHFGSFTSKEKAYEHRDYCMEHDWSERCKINGKGDLTPFKRIAHMFGVEVKDITRR